MVVPTSHTLLNMSTSFDAICVGDLVVLDAHSVIESIDNFSKFDMGFALDTIWLVIGVELVSSSNVQRVKKHYSKGLTYDLLLDLKRVTLLSANPDATRGITLATRGMYKARPGLRIVASTCHT